MTGEPCGVWYRAGSCILPRKHDGLHFTQEQRECSQALAAAEQRAQAAEAERDAAVAELVRLVHAADPAVKAVFRLMAAMNIDNHESQMNAYIDAQEPFQAFREALYGLPAVPGGEPAMTASDEKWRERIIVAESKLDQWRERIAAAEQRAQAAEAREDALRERERQVQDAVRLFVNRLDGIGMWADERLSGEERRWLTSELVKANTDLEAVSGILKARALLRAAEGGERDA